MPDISVITIWIGKVFLAILFVSVLTRLLTGSVRIQGLLVGRTASGARFVSAARVQMLVSTITAAGQCLGQVLNNPQTLPDIPHSLLWLVGGSHLLYQGVKFHGRLNRRFHV